MPVELTPGQSKELNVELTPINGEFDPWYYDFDEDCYIDDDEVLAAAADYNAGKITRDQMQQVEDLWLHKTRNPACPPGGLSIQRFFILTIPHTGDGYWQMNCDIYNPTDHVLSGSIHVTGRLWTEWASANFPVDEVFEFTVGARQTHRCSLNWNKYNYLPEGVSCWFEVDTSWGDKVPRTNWTAGFYTGDNRLNAHAITSSSAVLRYTSQYGGKKFRYTVWSPPTWPDHTIYEDCLMEDEYMSIYTTCYLHVLTLLSGRQYKAECSVDAKDYAETLFNTP